MQEVTSSWVARNWAAAADLAAHGPVLVRHHRRARVVIMHEELATEFLAWVGTQLIGTQLIGAQLPGSHSAGSVPVGSHPAGSVPVGSVPVGSQVIGSRTDVAAQGMGAFSVGNVADVAVRCAEEKQRREDRELVALLQRKFRTRRPRTWDEPYASILIGEVPEDRAALRAVADEYSDVEPAPEHF
jgi:hypothetical protein